MKILSGHVSPETAYVQTGYPYGFRLKCNIRFWLEYKPSKGFRFCSQTTNPKTGNVAWNKPKMATFSRFEVMFLDEKGHVQSAALSDYSNLKECLDFRTVYGSAMPEAAQNQLVTIIKLKIAYEEQKNQGQIKSVMTTREYGCITDANFGEPLTEKREETVLTSDYSPETLAGMKLQLA